MWRSALLVLLCFFAAGCAGSASNSRLIGNSAPRYTKFSLIDGSTVVLDQFRGRPVVVLFWAQSCNQSHSIVSELNEFASREAKRRGIEVVAVSIDKREDEEKLLDRITYGGLTSLRHAFSGNEIYDEAKIAFDVDTLPSVFIVDASGKVVAGGTRFSVVENYFGL